MSHGFGVVRSRRQAGISLIEVMITLTILAVVALALADGLVTSMRVTSVNEERAAAMRAARDKLEWITGSKQLLINSDPRGVTRAFYPRFVIDDVTGSKDHGVVVSIENPAGTFTPVCFDVFYAQKGQTATNASGTANEERLPGLYTTAAVATANGALAGEKPGEVVVMFDEDIFAPRADNTYAYGRDLTGGVVKPGAPAGSPDGKPDGTTFAPIGDMDMNGTIGGDMRAKGLNITLAGGPVGRVPVGVIIRWWGATGREERYELWTVMTFFQENFGAEDVGPFRYD